MEWGIGINFDNKCIRWCQQDSKPTFDILMTTYYLLLTLLHSAYYPTNFKINQVYTFTTETWLLYSLWDLLFPRLPLCNNSSSSFFCICSVSNELMNVFTSFRNLISWEEKCYYSAFCHVISKSSSKLLLLTRWSPRYILCITVRLLVWQISNIIIYSIS